MTMPSDLPAAPGEPNPTHAWAAKARKAGIDAILAQPAHRLIDLVRRPEQAPALAERMLADIMRAMLTVVGESSIDFEGNPRALFQVLHHAWPGFPLMVAAPPDLRLPGESE